MLSVLDFILALCKSSCDSFAWMTQITPRRPDGLPLRLLLLVIEIELKLRLPANLEGYLRVSDTSCGLLAIIIHRYVFYRHSSIFLLFP